MTHSILDRISGDKIKRDGSPRAIIENALPDDYYRELAETFPSMAHVVGGRELKSNRPYRTLAIEALQDPTLPQIWREFIAYHCSAEFYQRLIDVWGADIEAIHRHIAREFGKPLRDFTLGLRHEGKGDNPLNRTHDIMMDCQFSYNSPVQEVSSVRGPHLDSPQKLFVALLYFRYLDDRSTGGDLDFYRLVRGRYPKPKAARIDPGCVERFETVPYRPNLLVMFINSPFAIHGVTPRSITKWPRRYMNFLGECYRGRSNDFFIAVDPGAPRIWRSMMEIANRFL